MLQQLYWPAIVRARAVTSIIVIGLALFLLRVSAAQGALPVQWIYSPISYSYVNTTEEMPGGNSVAYSPDGTKTAVGGNAGVQIRSIVTGEVTCLASGATQGVNSVAFSPDGKTLAVGGNGIDSNGTTGVVEMWNVSTGKLISTFKTQSTLSINSVAFSPDGKTLADGGYSTATSSDYTSGVLEMWNVSTGKQIFELQTTASFVLSVAFSADGKILADGGGYGILGSAISGVLEEWSVTAGQLMFQPNQSAQTINSVAFSPDGQTLADCGGRYPCLLELWNASTNTRLNSLDTNANASAVSVTFSPDGNTLYLGGEFDDSYTGVVYGIIEGWDVASATLQSTFSVPSINTVSVACSPDGSTLVDSLWYLTEPTGYPNSCLDFWNISSGTLAKTVSITQTAASYSVAFSPDGETLAVGSAYQGSNGVLELWDVASGQLVALLKTTAITINCLAFSPDSKTLAAGGTQFLSTVNTVPGVLELWNVATGTLISRLATSATASVASVAFSPDGSTLADGGAHQLPANTGGTTGVLELWSVSTQQLIEQLDTTATVSVTSLAFSSDNKTLADGGVNAVGYVVELWDVKSNTLLKGLPNAPTAVDAVAFTPDGKTLAAGGSSSSDIVLWNVSSGSILTTVPLLSSAGYVESLVISPDGKAILVGTTKDLEGFSTSNYNSLGYYETDQVSEGPVAASPNGSLLAFGGPYYLVVAADPFDSTVPISDLTVNPTTVTGGQSSIGTVTLSKAAPPGGNMVILSSASPWDRVPGSVLVPGGSTQATFMISTSQVAVSTTVTITASSGGDSASASLAIAAIGPQSLTVSPASVVGGTSSTGMVTLNEPASGNGAVVSLSSNSPNASTPTSVTVAAGATTATFSIATVAVAAPINATITAALGNATAEATLAVLPPGLESLSVSPTSVVGGVPSTGTVTLNGPAPTGGTVVKLSSSSSSASPPNAITVAGGATSASFSISTSAVAATTQATISGTVGANTMTSILVISVASISAVTVSPTTVLGGISSAGTVTLTGPAGVGGMVVSLSSSNPSATVPATVTVSSGTTSASFSINTTPVSTSTPVTVTASEGVSKQAATLTVTPALLAIVTISPTSVLGGQPSSGTVTLNGKAPTGGTSISLTSGSSNATVPATVTVSAGSTTAKFLVSTTAVSSTTLSPITGSQGSITQTATLTIVPAALSGLTVSPATVIGGGSSTATVTLNGPAGPGGSQVSVTSSSSSATVPATVTISAGATSATLAIATSPVTTAVSATITCALGGETKSATLTINPAGLASLTVSPASVVGGNSSTGTAALNGPAPAGGTSISLASNSTNSTAPASVSVAAGASSATFAIMTTAVPSNTTATITGTLGAVQKSATLTIDAAAIIGLTVSPTSVIGGNSSTGTVTLNGTAPHGGMSCSLASGSTSAIVPSSVTVPDGASSATFPIETLGVSTAVNATITASQGTVSKTATLTVVPAVLSNLTVSPTTVVGGTSASGTVTLSGLAPSGGLILSLGSSTSDVKVPPSVTIASGTLSASFPISTTSVSSSVSATITATQGGTSKVAILTVNPLALASLSLYPVSVTGGSTSTGTVMLNGPAGPGGVVVALASSLTAATCPSSVTISAGQSNASFTVATSAVKAQVSVTITAKLNSVSQTANLMIAPPALASVGLNPTSLSGGTSSVGTVTLSGPAPVGGLVLKLVSSSTKAIVPSTVSIEAGRASSTFTVKTTSVGTQVSATISATLGTVEQTATLTINPPALETITISPATVIGLTSSTGTVTLSGPAPAGGIVVSLSSNLSAATVPSKVTVLSGKKSVSFVVKTVSVDAQAVATVTASLNSVNVSASLTINPPVVTSLVLNPTSVVGGGVSTGTVTLGTVAPIGGVSVILSSNNGNATVPTSVAVPAGKNSAKFTILTVVVSAQVTATISATLGTTIKTANLTVKK